MSDSPPLHARDFRLRRFANWFPLGLTYATLYMGRYNFNVYRNHADTIHGLSNRDIGIVATVGFWVYASSVLVNGPIAEKLGGRRAILIGVTGSCAANAAIAVAFRGGWMTNVVIGLSILYAINMYFQSFGALSVVKVNAAWFHWRERGVLGGVFGSMISLGYYLALGVCGIVYVYAPYWALFLLPSGVLLAMFVVDFLLVRDRPSHAGHADFDTGDEAEGTHDERPLAFGDVLGRVFSHPVLRVLTLAEFCTGVVRQGLLLHYGKFLAQVHHVNESATPRRYQVASLGITIGGIAGAMLCGVLSDKLFGSRRAPVAFLFYIGQIVALTALGFAPPTEAGSYAAALLVGFSCMWIFGVHGMLSGTASMDFGGRRAAATAAGLLDGVQYVGSGLAGFGLGWLLDRYHWAVWPYAMLPFSVVGGALMLKLWNARPAPRAAH